MLRFCDRSKHQDNIIFRCIYFLWKTSCEAYYQITGRAYPTLDLQLNKKEKLQQCPYVKQMYIAIIFVLLVSIFSIINFAFSFLLSEGSTTSATTISYKTKTEPMVEYSIRHIYIDIGCFNGETIEHFIHFIPNSAMYDIYTFEPDPDNYRLCKNRLSQKKYAHLNITILQKVVWIRDEIVYFRAEGGRQSRISLNVTEDDGESIELDAIDFSSWLARLVKPNKTKISIKMSMPGAEVLVLEKMILDDTLGLASKYKVEWTDRDNPHIRATRIYIQLMFDNYGFDCLYYTRLHDARKIYRINGTFNNITKYYDWNKLSEFDTLAHYAERSDTPLS